MKKILAAILALAMMLTVAFAAEYKPGTTIEIQGDDAGWDAALEKDLDSGNYYVSGTTWTKGKDLVESVKIASADDEGGLVITLKQDYANDADKALEGTVTIRQKGATATHKLEVKTTVGYDAETVNIDFDGEIENIYADDETVYTFEKTANGKSYGVMTLVADGCEVAVRVYDGESFYLASSNDPDKAILKANADSDADPSFLNFPGAPKFSGTATITFFDLTKDSIIYELSDGKLTKSAAEWDAENETWTLKTKTLGSYVLSDAALKSASGTTGDGSSSAGSSNDSTANPDTGANDVVGVASALALVALVSAAAVSLKK